MTKARVLNADCLTVLRKLPDNSMHAIVTDPPYGLSNTDPKHVAETIVKWASGEREYAPTGKGFMGKEWDAFVPPPAVWDECFRVLKPGGHLLCFAGTRTMGLMDLSIRLAGFDIRDSLAWLYGSGFPKSMDMAKALDKHLKVDGTLGGPKSAAHAGWIERGAMRKVGGSEGNEGWQSPWMDDPEAVDRNAREYLPGSEQGQDWKGWGTALKPAFEPIIMARKPFKGIVAKNVIEHGVGPLNIDGTRIGTEPAFTNRRGGVSAGGLMNDTDRERTTSGGAGRWPANVLLDESQAAALDEQSGVSFSTQATTHRDRQDTDNEVYGHGLGTVSPTNTYSDSGGASRFFYVAKANRHERPDVDGVKHPTVKPLALMQWLVKLVTPTGGIVLDPFGGSGTTAEAAYLEGFDSLTLEADASYIPLIQSRIQRAREQLEADVEQPE